jgi:hypothetical protein
LEAKLNTNQGRPVEWFSFDHIPKPLSIGHKRRIKDAIAGETGVAVQQETPTCPQGPGIYQGKN